MSSFDQAVSDSRNLKAKPSDDELLQLYGLFKVGSGEKIEDSQAPGMFDLKGKAKRKAWQKVVDAGTSQDDAQKQYIALVEKLKEKLGFNA